MNDRYIPYEERVAAAPNIPLALRILYQIGYNPQRLGKNVLYDRCDIWLGAARGVVTLIVVSAIWFLSTYAAWDIGTNGKTAPAWNVVGLFFILGYILILFITMINLIWNAIEWSWEYAYEVCSRNEAYYAIKSRSKPPANKKR